MTSEIMNHLMFHKALLDEDVDIDYYIDMAEKLEHGVHLSAKDPVDRAVAIAFELVIQEKLNPWKIDLKKFVSLYMKRIKDEREIDFIIAGKIIYMAWNILKKKSELVLDSMSVEEEENFESFDSWAMDFDLGGGFEVYETTTEENVDYDVMNTMKLREPVRREEQRPVSLFDLITAINEAKREIEKKKKRKKIREKFKFNLEEKVHKEDLEEEIKEVWERIIDSGEKELALSLIYDGSNEEFVKVFISLLFLEKFGKVELQQYVPYEEIYIRVIDNQIAKDAEITTSPEFSLVQL